MNAKCPVVTLLNSLREKKSLENLPEPSGSGSSNQIAATFHRQNSSSLFTWLLQNNDETCSDNLLTYPSSRFNNLKIRRAAEGRCSVCAASSADSLGDYSRLANMFAHFDGKLTNRAPSPVRSAEGPRRESTTDRLAGQARHLVVFKKRVVVSALALFAADCSSAATFVRAEKRCVVPPRLPTEVSCGTHQPKRR